MTKIGYVTIGAKDSEASVKFYDAVFKALAMSANSTRAAGPAMARSARIRVSRACHTMLCKPQDGKEARAGNGIMISYKAPSPDAVKAAHAGGMANGGTDEGAPGFRPPEATSGFFGAYLRDPTGNKICIFTVEK